MDGTRRLGHRRSLRPGRTFHSLEDRSVSSESIQAPDDPAFPKFTGTPERNFLRTGAIVAVVAYIVPATIFCIAGGFKLSVFVTYLIGQPKVFGNIIWLVQGIPQGRPFTYWIASLMTISQIVFWTGLVMVAIGLVRKVRNAT